MSLCFVALKRPGGCQIRPKPIVVSGGHVNPFTPAKDENRIARDYLIRWGIPKADGLGEGNSRDTFESAVEVEKLLLQKGWKRYLLVTSAAHMPRSMLDSKPKRRSPSQRPGISRLANSNWNLSRADFPSSICGRSSAPEAWPVGRSSAVAGPSSGLQSEKSRDYFTSSITRMAA